MSTTTTSTAPEFTVTGQWPAPDYASPDQRRAKDADLAELVFDPTLTRSQARVMLDLLAPGDLDEFERAHLVTVAAGEDLKGDLDQFDN
jgi:hypothetical protein